MHMIKVISLDANGTTVDDSKLIHDFWYRLIPRELAKVRGIKFSEAKKICVKEYRKHHEKFGADKNYISPNYWIKKFKINKEPIEIFREAKGDIVIYPEVHKAIRYLSKKYQIIISSDHPASFLEISLSKVDLSKISYIFSSNDMRLSKKDKKFWKHIIKTLKVKPNEILHIGDRYINDYISPMKSGLNSFLIKRDKGVNLTDAIKIMKL